MYEIFPQTQIGNDKKNIQLVFDGIGTPSFSEAKRLCDSSCRCEGFTVSTLNNKPEYNFYSNVHDTFYVDSPVKLYLKKKNTNYPFVFGVLLVMFLVLIYKTLY